jgi:hypothetical protein
MKASSTTAYEQVTQWQQNWQSMDMSRPLVPVNNTDASNDGVQKAIDLEPGSGPSLPGPQGLNVFA